MDDFKGLVEDFMGELLDAAVRNLRVNNPEYKKLDSKNDAIMEKIEKMMAKMNDNEQRLIAEFCDGLLDMEGMKQRYFYQCGFRDCLKFIRFMDK